MRTFAKSRIRYSKSQRLGIFAFIVFLFIFEILRTHSSENTSLSPTDTIPNEVLKLYTDTTSTQNNSYFSEIELTEFNPNALSREEWMELGFSERQAESILKYKYSLGGSFLTKEEIKNCYVISENKFLELEAYIKIGEVTSSKSSSFYTNYEPSKSNIHYKSFNPNSYSIEDWMNIGFSERQASTILKYKHSLGGEFKSLEQIAQCYVISEEKFLEIKPYVVLATNKKIVETKSIENTSEVEIIKINPNKLSISDWMDLGFSEKQGQVIMNYKNSLGGNFLDAQTLSRCYVISEEKMEELLPFLDFSE